MGAPAATIAASRARTPMTTTHDIPNRRRLRSLLAFMRVGASLPL
jgi:hypothetical protein